MPMSGGRHARPSLSSDAPAVQLTSCGGPTYEDLYVEHAPAARMVALTLVPPDVAEDIVAEAFTRVLSAIRSGREPQQFRAYLLMTVRNAGLDWLRARKRVTAVGDLDVDVEPPEAVADRGYVSPWIDRPADAHAEARSEGRRVGKEGKSRWS